MLVSLKPSSDESLCSLHLAVFASTANTSGARSNATNALAKSRAVIGLKPGDTTNKAVRKGDDNSGRIAEVRYLSIRSVAQQI